MRFNRRSYSGGSESMPRMIRMTLQNRECPVDLLQQNHASQFMRQRHPAQRDRMLRRVAGRFAESIGRPHREDQRQRIAILDSLPENAPTLRTKTASPANPSRPALIFQHPLSCSPWPVMPGRTFAEAQPHPAVPALRPAHNAKSASDTHPSAIESPALSSFQSMRF